MVLLGLVSVRLGEIYILTRIWWVNGLHGNSPLVCPNLFIKTSIMGLVSELGTVVAESCRCVFEGRMLGEGPGLHQPRGCLHHGPRSRPKLM